MDRWTIDTYIDGASSSPRAPDNDDALDSAAASSPGYVDTCMDGRIDR